MTLASTLPMGIRNNNPGNLRAAYNMKYPTKLNGGFAVFQSISDGCQALAALTFDYYSHHGLRFLPDFLAKYAPASENDLLAYQQNMLSVLGQPYIGMEKRDLLLDRSWNGLAFMRALVICENGHPPTGWLPTGEWIDQTTWNAAMMRACRWRIV